MDWLDKIWPWARIGFFEGQASAFYNVSKIERDYFEMWYFDNLRAYKGAAHGASRLVDEGHASMRKALQNIRKEAEMLTRLGNKEGAGKQPFDPSQLWTSGAYTNLNADRN